MFENDFLNIKNSIQVVVVAFLFSVTKKFKIRSDILFVFLFFLFVLQETF